MFRKSSTTISTKSYYLRNWTLRSRSSFDTLDTHMLQYQKGCFPSLQVYTTISQPAESMQLWSPD